MQSYEVQFREFTITTDPRRIRFEEVCALLDTTAWAKRRPRSVMRVALEHSLCFAVIQQQQRLAGFARTITDCGTFAYLADVIIRQDLRGQGLGKRLVQSVLAHPDLKGMRRWMLVTPDTQELYAAYGFAAPEHPDHVMERLQPYAQESVPAE